MPRDRSGLFSALGLVLLGLAGCAGIDWREAKMTEVQFQSMATSVRTTVRDPDDIAFMREAFRRATKVAPVQKADYEPLGRQWAISLHGERPFSGIWLYDPASGRFTRLDPFTHPIYCFNEKDRDRINQLQVQLAHRAAEDGRLTGTFTHASSDAELALTLQPDGTYIETVIGGLAEIPDGQTTGQPPRERRGAGRYRIVDGIVQLLNSRGTITRQLTILHTAETVQLEEQLGAGGLRQYRALRSNSRIP